MTGAEAIQAARNAKSLPYDVLLDLFTFLDATDIVNFLSSSKLLYSHILDETIWRKLSARYGVRDLSIFGGHTWYDVYTCLLHTYGPLLGLWANDYPFRGNIMECRINVDRKWYGIICEVWKFPAGNDLPDNDRDPSLPSYHESFRIVLTREGIDASGTGCRTRIQWYPHSQQGVSFDDMDRHQTPSLHLLSPTNQATFVHIGENIAILAGGEHPRMTGRLPDFPGTETVWYEHSRECPRMPQEPSFECLDSREFLSQSARTRASYMYSARVAHTFPPALSIYPHPDRGDPLRLHTPQLPRILLDLRGTSTGDGGSNVPVRNRYYPLRSPVREAPTTDVGASDWDPTVLEGIWLGGYGAHGTEVLFLEWSSEGKEVRAWKVTGDVNVPRGAISWRFEVAEDQPDILANAFEELHPRALYRGVGTISSFGFLPGEQAETPLYVALMDWDDIRVRWPELLSTSRFRRYKGRDLASEQVNGGMRKPTPWL
ncbi:unnamed protein product [Somion occarium]|uniref:F-box domain-containing protein n=1 Tax=Somion occarium TaxID=3059160 RepID=A0ABP1DD34_9APHY